MTYTPATMHNNYKLQWIHDDTQLHIVIGSLDTLQYIFELLSIDTTTDAQIWDMSVDPPARIQ